MKTKISLLFTLILISVNFLYAASPVSDSATIVSSPEKMLFLSPKQFEKVTGKRLTLKEKIIYKLLQLKLKKELKKNPPEINERAERQANNALFAGIATWGFFLIGAVVPVVGLFAIPFAIAALAFGASSLNKAESNVKPLIGIISGGLYLILLLIAVGVVAGSI